MLRQIIEVAHKRNRWVGICGELGGETRYLPLLLGLGVDEFSMSGTRIPAAKNAAAPTGFERVSGTGSSDLWNAAPVSKLSSNWMRSFLAATK